MKLKNVTITGADSNTSIDDIIRVSKRFPFVEWGILVSSTSISKQRFPDVDWIHDLLNHLSRELALNPVSLHLCGPSVKDLLDGVIRHELRSLILHQNVKRLQVNVAMSSKKIDYVDNMCKVLEATKLVRPDLSVIVQDNLKNRGLGLTMLETDRGIWPHILHDASGGRGILSKSWKRPITGFYNGYAGGLSPENIRRELEDLFPVIGEGVIWIDVETGVRTNNELDISKVVDFLSACEPRTI